MSESLFERVNAGARDMIEQMLRNRLAEMYANRWIPKPRGFPLKENKHGWYELRDSRWHCRNATREEWWEHYYGGLSGVTNVAVGAEGLRVRFRSPNELPPETQD